MTIKSLGTSNTFTQWLTLTQELVPHVNEKFIDFTVDPLYSNTNIDIEDSELNIVGNLSVGGNVSLGSFNEGSLIISGDVSVGTIPTTPPAEVYDLIVTGNLSISSYDITTNYLRANNVFTPDLIVNSNAIFANTLTLSTMNVENSNISSLIGPAYIKIDQKIKSSNAYVFTQDNIASFIAFSIGLG
jgi:hypothetical protein